MPDLEAAYHDAREAMIKLARGADEIATTTYVPACPDWTVRTLLAHVTSLATEISSGRMPLNLNLIQFWDDDVARRRDEFVETALEQRRARDLNEILDEWERSGPRIEKMIGGAEPFPEGSMPLTEWILVTDVGVHLQDLQGALGTTEFKDALASSLALRSYVEAMRVRSVHEKIPAFRIRADNREWVIGNGDPVATLTGETWELGRAASGRRSPDQVRAYDWDGDPEPYLPLFYPYGVRESALVE